VPQPRQREGRIWLWAFLITLFLHGLLLALVLMLRPFEPRLAEAREPEPIAMVFQRPAAPETENQASEQPSTFTELPEDRADQRPENPELLSNVDSRARDRTEGGEAGAMPRLQGQSEAPHVGMTPSSQGAPQASTPVPDEGDPESVAERDERTPLPGGELPVPSAQTEESGSSPEELLRSGQEDGQPEGRRETPRDPRDELLRNQGMAIPQLQRPDKGMQDIFQEEMYNPGGNSALFGDVSLNTLAWPYASWLQRFRRDFVRNWVAPYAYYLGLIHGWTLVELEIDHNGRMLRLDVLGEEGHKSLGQQSVASFKATAPFRPLPPNFPEPTLILRIKLIYPEH
jgi:hypothetical protein